MSSQVIASTTVKELIELSSVIALLGVVCSPLPIKQLDSSISVFRDANLQPQTVFF
jgi:hypothetical protein